MGGVDLSDQRVGTYRPTAIESYNKHMGGVDLSDQRVGTYRPTAIESYNKHMGGVDLLDQRVGTYRRHMKSLTWYMQLFFHILEISAVQAYLLHKELHNDGMTQRVFFIGLIDVLIGSRVATPGNVVALPWSVHQPKHASTDNLTMRPSSSPPSRNVLSTCVESTNSTLVLCVMCAFARTHALAGTITRWSMGMKTQKRQLPLQPESESANSALHIVITVMLCA